MPQSCQKKTPFFKIKF